MADDAEYPAATGRDTAGRDAAVGRRVQGAWHPGVRPGP
jgi:hypothetical protein